MRVAHLRPFASRLRPVFVLLAALLSPPHLFAQEPIVGLPCEGCEAVFQGLPSALGSTARIARAGEPGTPMTITGRVLGPDSRPRSGVVVYVCQTNARGVYPPPSRALGAAADRHGALRAWAVCRDRRRWALCLRDDPSRVVSLARHTRTRAHARDRARLRHLSRNP